MSNEITEYLVVDYIDELEEATYSAESNSMAEIVEKLNKVHGDLVDLANLVDSKEKAEMVKNEIHSSLAKILQSCRENETTVANENIDNMSSKIKNLSDIWQS